MTEKDIKEWLRGIRPYLCSCTNQYHLEGVIENMAHELYTKLITAPSDLRGKVATEAGLSFQRELIRQSRIPLTGASSQLREMIEQIDPKAWESICYAVVDTLHSLYVQAGWKSPRSEEK